MALSCTCLGAIFLGEQAPALREPPLGVAIAPALVPNSRSRAAASFNSTFARRSPPPRPCSSRSRRANAYWLGAQNPVESGGIARPLSRQRHNRLTARLLALV